MPLDGIPRWRLSAILKRRRLILPLLAAILLSARRIVRSLRNIVRVGLPILPNSATPELIRKVAEILQKKHQMFDYSQVPKKVLEPLATAKTRFDIQNLWRQYFYPEGLTPEQAMIEVRDALLPKEKLREPHELAFDELREGVSRCLLMRYPAQGGSATEAEEGMAVNCFDRSLVDAVTSSLVTAAGIQMPAEGRSGGSGQTSSFVAEMFQLKVFSMPRIQSLVVTSQTMLCHAFLNFVGFQSRVFETRHGQIHVYDNGWEGKAGTPLVLLHGVAATSHSLMPLALLLGVKGIRVMLVDLLDFDLSFSRSPTRTTGFTEQIQSVGDLLQAVAQENNGPVDLGGHSFGGWVAQRTALSVPDSVRRMVLLAPSGHGRYRCWRSVWPFALFTGAMDPLSQGVAKQVIGQPSPVVSIMRSIMTPIMWNHYMVSLCAQLLPLYFERSAPLQHEALVIWGSLENWNVPYPGAHGEKMLLRDIPRGQLEFLPADHVLAWEVPMKLTQKVYDFLQKTWSPSSKL